MKEKSVKLSLDELSEGSLGLLALGDIGIDAWRRARQQKKELSSKNPAGDKKNNS